MSGTTLQTQVDYNQLILNTINIAQDLLNDIFSQINLLESFQDSKEYYFNSRLTELSEDICKFVELTTLASKILLLKNKGSLPQIKESHIHLLFILKGMNQAQQKQDIIVLEDLIKYELADNLKQWKIDLILQIKRQINL